MRIRYYRQFARPDRNDVLIACQYPACGGFNGIKGANIRGYYRTIYDLMRAGF